MIGSTVEVAEAVFLLMSFVESFCLCFSSVVAVSDRFFLQFFIFHIDPVFLLLDVYIILHFYPPQMDFYWNDQACDGFHLFHWHCLLQFYNNYINTYKYSLHIRAAQCVCARARVCPCSVSNLESNTFIQFCFVQRQENRCSRTLF